MKFKLFPLYAAVLFILCQQSGLAQDIARKAPSENSRQQGALEEIRVVGKYSVDQTKTLDTATGLGLTIQETPQSVSILTAERMQDQNITSILDAVNNAVGVSSAEVDNVRNDFYSRGFKIDSYQIDGVPTSWSLGGDSGETVADTVIYERIEFVRGATGLMTGVGDPSASINLVRKHANMPILIIVVVSIAVIGLVLGLLGAVVGIVAMLLKLALFVVLPVAAVIWLVRWLGRDRDEYAGSGW